MLLSRLILLSLLLAVPCISAKAQYRGGKEVPLTVVTNDGNFRSLIDHLDGKMWTEYKVCHGDTCKEYGDKLYYYVGGWRAVVDNGDTVLEANWETVTYRTDSPDGIPSLVRVTCAPIFVIKKCIKTNPLTFTIVQVTNIQIENELSLQDSSQFIVSGESWFNDDNNNYAFFRLSKPTKETTSLLNGSNK